MSKVIVGISRLTFLGIGRTDECGEESQKCSNFHHGVVGIVASKIVDKYYKPTIIMEEKDGIAKASCRSIEGYSIIDGLNSMKELFIKYGGHPGAAGFSIEAHKVDEFRKRINKHAREKLSKEDYKKPIKISKEVSFTSLSLNFLMNYFVSFLLL